MPRKSEETALRQSIIDHCVNMNAGGINQGTSGNISARYGDHMLITPSGIPYDELKPKDIAAMPIAANDGSWEGPLKPSSEWRFHLDIMKARDNVNAVVHAHSTYSTILAIARKPIPSCHYMIAAFGGNDVRCADYATYGTEALSKHALKALKGRECCLLANHGMIAVGTNLKKAMWVAIELETIAKQYYHSLLIGGPVLLSDQQIKDTAKSFTTYGLQDKKGAKKRAA